MYLKVNIAAKRGKVHKEDLKLEDISTLDTVELTRRILPFQLYSIFYPLRVLVPITIKYKLLLQKLSVAKLDLDKKLIR